MLSRSFRAANGEIGVLLSDASEFLDACEADRLTVLGWEAWIADHRWDASANAPVPARGCWCGIIPVQGSDIPSVIHGTGGISEVRKQLADLDLTALVAGPWLSHVRLNFTLDA